MPCLWWPHPVLLSLGCSPAPVTVNLSVTEESEHTTGLLSEVASPSAGHLEKCPSSHFLLRFRSSLWFLNKDWLGKWVRRNDTESRRRDFRPPGTCWCVPSLSSTPSDCYGLLQGSTLEGCGGFPTESMALRSLTPPRLHSRLSTEMLLPIAPPPRKQEVVRPLCHKLGNDHLYSS